MNTNQIIKNIKSVVAKFPQVEFAYLFGSFALGNEHKDSDVDVAVKLSDKMNKDERFDFCLNLIGELEHVLKKDVDVIVLNDAKDLFFRYIIIKEGKLVFRKTDLPQMLFETRVFNEYFDYEPFFDAYNKAYVQRSLQ